MTKILSDNEITPTEWDELEERAWTSSFFQTKSCYDFYRELPFVEDFVVGVREQERLMGLCCGYLTAEGGRAKAFFSRRAIIPGGLLLDKNISPEAIKALLQALKKKLRHQAIYIEVRNYNDYAMFRLPIEESGFAYRKHLNIQLNTLPSNDIKNKLSASKRRQLKRNEQAGLCCYLSRDKEDVKDFYNILSERYRQKVKKPLFPLAFFELLVQKPFARFWTVKLNEKNMGGIVCVDYRGAVLYEWFVCGADRNDQGVYPSLAATWAAVEYAHKEGFRYFDFMGAGKPDESYGVRDFKSRFGGQSVEYGRFIHVCKPGLFRLGSFVMRLKHRLSARLT